MNVDLLHDLTAYKSSRDKGVVNAARSLISLYRDVAPDMLLKKDRGKTVSMGMAAGEIEGKNLQFGVERNVTTGIEGLDLLEAWKKEQGELDGEDNEDGDDDLVFVTDREDWKDWEVGSEEDSDSDDAGWIDVPSDDHGIDISDSEDEQSHPPPLKADPSTSTLATSKVPPLPRHPH
jgi:protein SDA1